MGADARGPAGANGRASDDNWERPHGTPHGDPPPPGFTDLGNGMLRGSLATADGCRAAAAWLQRHYPEHSQDPPTGMTGAIYNMGHNLYRMTRGSSTLPGMTALEQAVLLVLADICMDTTRRPPPNMNAGTRVCEDLGITPGTLSNILTKLSARGIQLRVAIGKDKRGRMVYAAKGHAVDYLFPDLPPRSKGPSSDEPLEPEGSSLDGALSAKGSSLDGQRSTPGWTPTPVTPNSKDDTRSLSSVAPLATDRAREASDDERENEDSGDDDEDEELDPDVALILEAVPDADVLDAEWVATSLQYRKFCGEIRNTVRGYLRTLIKNGDILSLLEDAKAERRSAHELVEAERHAGPFHQAADPWEPTVPARPQWCGQCDERTRLLELGDGRMVRCESCNPNATSTPGPRVIPGEAEWKAPAGVPERTPAPPAGTPEPENPEPSPPGEADATAPLPEPAQAAAPDAAKPPEMSFEDHRQRKLAEFEQAMREHPEWAAQ